MALCLGYLQLWSCSCPLKKKTDLNVQMNWFERWDNDVLIHPCMLDYMLYIIFKHIMQNILALIIDWFTCQCMDAWELPEKPNVYLHASYLLIIQSWVKYLLVVACKCHIPFSITRMSYKYRNNGRHLKDVCWVGIIAIDLMWLCVNLFCFYFKMHPRNSFDTGGGGLGVKLVKAVWLPPLSL